MRKCKLFILTWVIFGLFCTCATTTSQDNGLLKTETYSEPISTADDQNVETAVENACLKIVEKIPDGSTVVVLSVHSSDDGISGGIKDFMTMNLLNSGKFVVKAIEFFFLSIRPDMDFNIYGKANDADAVSIGKEFGCNVILTAEITGTEADETLTIKAFFLK
jgi:hypothetical protein